MALIDKKTRRFIEAYSDFYPVVYSAVFAHVQDPDDAKDICQEIFTRFYDKYDEVENHRGWLFGAARYVILEHFRKNRRKVDIDTVLDDENTGFVNGFRETRLVLKEALENPDNFSDERERILFELVAVHDFTYRDAGRQLGLSERQVRYRYGIITERILRYLGVRGIKRLDDLL